MRFSKYQALGNDYLVVDAKEFDAEPSAGLVRLLTHRNFGIGSDGILVGERLESGSFRLRIFNPDGGEAEKSGNGLRIYARSLFDAAEVSEESFAVETLGGAVRCQVTHGGARVRVEMGRVVFDSRSIPVAGPPREVLQESIRVGDRDFEFSAASVGNPHCVIFMSDPQERDARELGPAIESDPRFPNRSNVQFAQVLDRNNLRIEIWERGAGYTMASGTSSCAAAGVAVKLELCDRQITVHMPGGDLEVEFDEDFAASIDGPVSRIAEGRVSEETLRRVSNDG